MKSLGRQALTAGQRDKAARRIVGGLRRMLARAAVQALEPDLVILDEFQRFRDLLDVKTGGEAAELAHDFLQLNPMRASCCSRQRRTNRLRMSEETTDGGGHYEDFLKTLEFLAASEEPVDTLRADLGALRQAALSGEPTAAIRDRVQAQLRRWIARTERPTDTRHATALRNDHGSVRCPRGRLCLGYVALRRVADAVEAPLSVEYWKSAPYFLNFLTGYRVGEQVRDAMKVPDRRASADAAVSWRAADREVRRSAIPAARVGECSNASVSPRRRSIRAGGDCSGCRRPCPTDRLGGPYASVDSTAITKKLIFSSWVAAPSAIASPPELRGPAADLHGSRSRSTNTSRSPSGDFESPRLSDGRRAAGFDVGACIVLAAAGACVAYRSARRCP